MVGNPVWPQRPDPQGRGGRPGPAQLTGSCGNLEGVSQWNASAGGPERTRPSAATVASRLQHQQDAACIPAAGVGGGRATHPEYPLQLIPAPEITLHAAQGSTGRKPNKAFTFLHFLRIVSARREETTALYLDPGSFKIDAVLFSPQKHQVLRQSQRKPCSSRGPHRKVLWCSPLWSPSKTAPPPQSSDSGLQWLMGYLLAAAALWEACNRKVMGIPASWGRARLWRGSNHNRADLRARSNHGGKISQISLHRTEKHLLKLSSIIQAGNSPSRRPKCRLR